LVAGLLIALPLLAWRLSSGPIALDFLTPYIEQALTAKDGSVAVKLRTTVLAMAPGQRLLEIRAEDVRAYAGGERPMAVVPEMALSINGRALLAGILAPNSIRLYRPEITLVRNASGELQFGVGNAPEAGGDGSTTEIMPLLKDALMGVPDPGKPGRHLQNFAIKGAVVTVEDVALGTTWRVPEVNVQVRRVADGLTVEGQVAIENGVELGGIDLRGSYHRGTDTVDGEMRLSNLRLSPLARLGGALTELAALDLPLSGTVKAQATLAGVLNGLSFDLAGGAGRFTLTQPLEVTYAIAAASLRGRVGEGMRRLDLDELMIDLGGPVVTVSAVADGLGGDTVIKAEGVLRNTPVDMVPQLWPKGLADNARNWVVPNLSKGVVPEARITVSARSPSGRFDDVVIDHLGGEVRPEGVTVDYLRPMPPARNVSAVCTFDTKAFRIALKGGEVFGLTLKDGFVNLTGLDEFDQFADIELQIAGPATDALRLIDHKPLQFASALGIKPEQIGGESFTKVRFKFPLLHALRIEDVDVKAHASVKGAAIPDVLMGLDLSQGQLELDVDGKGLDASGPVVLGNTPVELSWRENFAIKSAPFRSRYHIRAASVSENERRRVGLDGPPFVAPYVAGPVGGEVVATLNEGGKGEVEVKVDLGAAVMDLPGLGWHKNAGQPGTADVLVRLDRNRVAAVPRFVVQAGDLGTSGQVLFNGEGQVRRVEFHKAVYGRTDGEGSLTFRPGEPGLDLAFKGNSFDAKPVISADKTPDGASRKKKDEDKLPPMSIAANVKTLWLSDAGSLSNATASLHRNAEDWRNVTVNGTVGQGKAFALVLQPGGLKRRALSVTSDDAGAVARAFDFYNDLSGGKLEVVGHFDDAKAIQPLVGTIQVSDYHVRNAPALARLLTVAALSGIVDLLQGEGVGFSSLEAPFTLSDGLLEVRDARAYGPALGITGKGQIDLDRGVLALEGTVVPAYVINSVLGKIPVLGWLVTGGEKGSGFFAFNYGMKGSTANPDVTVNPLSVLTPGFLRNLFNIFGSDTEARKSTKEEGK
jgi:hypothetical protein